MIEINDKFQIKIIIESLRNELILNGYLEGLTSEKTIAISQKSTLNWTIKLRNAFWEFIKKGKKTYFHYIEQAL